MSITATAQQNHLRDLAIAAIKQAHREIGQTDEPLVPLVEPALRLEAKNEKESKAARLSADKASLLHGPRPRGSRRRAVLWTFLGLLGIAVAGLAWQKASELATRDPLSTGTVTTANREAAEAAISSGAAVDTEVAPPQTAPQISSQRALQLAQAAPDPAQPLGAVRELANVQQAIEQLKIERAQAIRDNAEIAERLIATQEMARRNAELAENLKAAQAQMARQNGELAEDLKAARAQMARDSAELAERLKASQEQMAKLSDQLKTSQEQLARMIAEQKPRPRPAAAPSPAPAANAVRKPAPAPTTPASPQARVQPQKPKPEPPKPQ